MWKNILGTVGGTAQYISTTNIKDSLYISKTSVALKVAKNSLNDIVVYL